MLEENFFDTSTSFHACFHGKLDIVSSFIKHNYILVYAFSDNGFTCLHMASESGHIDIVKYLISQG